jgi:hypothetical protein
MSQFIIHLTFLLSLTSSSYSRSIINKVYYMLNDIIEKLIIIIKF